MLGTDPRALYTLQKHVPTELQPPVSGFTSMSITVRVCQSLWVLIPTQQFTPPLLHIFRWVCFRFPKKKTEETLTAKLAHVLDAGSRIWKEKWPLCERKKREAGVAQAPCPAKPCTVCRPRKAGAVWPGQAC